MFLFYRHSRDDDDLHYSLEEEEDELSDVKQHKVSSTTKKSSKYVKYLFC